MDVTIDDVERAADRLAGESAVVRTPTQYAPALSDRTGAAIYPKMEHLQRTGSFKPRGAFNKIRQLADSGAVREVVAASAGNHAQGVALAAATVGIDATIVMPETAPQTKIEATESHGATVELHGSDFRAAMEYAQSLTAAEDRAFVHAYDDPDVIAGQGTIGLEIAEDCPEADTVIVPIGGGGLISGVAVALAAVAPDVRVVGVQAAGAATVPTSLDKGQPHSLDSVDTVADGIATGGISERTLTIIDEYVDEVVTVDEREIANGVLVLIEDAKQVVEGAGAVPISAILSDQIDVAGETVVPVLSGGNLDMTMLEEIIDYVLGHRQRLIRLQVRIDDRPGKMEQLSGLIADHDANIRTVRHERGSGDLQLGEAFLHFEIETTGSAQTQRILESIEDAGYSVTRLP